MRGLRNPSRLCLPVDLGPLRLHCVQIVEDGSEMLSQRHARRLAIAFYQSIDDMLVVIDVVVDASLGLYPRVSISMEMLLSLIHI